jgi:hypothetical protein
VIETYEPNGPTESDKYFVREILYGLFSSLYLGFMVYLAWAVTKHDAADPLELMIQEDTRQWILDRLRLVTADGREGAPPILAVLEELKAHPVAPTRAQWPEGYEPPTDEDILRVQESYVRYLMRRYGNWEPVHEGP